MGLIIDPYRVSPWTPAAVAPYFWFISDHTSNTYSSNDYVTMHDVSGNGRTATAIGGTKPTKQPADIGGRQTVLQDANGEGFQISNATGVAQNKTGGTLIAVYGVTPVSALQRYLLFAETNSATFTRMALLSGDGVSDGTPRIQARRDEAGTLGVLSAAAAFLTPTITVGIVDYANSDAYIRVNGALSNSTTSFLTNGNSPNTPSANAPWIGRTNGGGTETHRGTYGELLWFDSVLSTENVERIEGYLAWQWGLVSNLPGGHPYKNNPP